MGPEMTGPPMNGISGNSESIEGMKNSPANGPSTPREDGAPLSDYGMSGYEENVSILILLRFACVYQSVISF